MVAGDFDEPLTYRQKTILAVLAHDHFARHHLGHQWDVLGENPQLALYARQGDHVHVFRVHRCVRGDDFQS